MPLLVPLVASLPLPLLRATGLSAVVFLAAGAGACLTASAGHRRVARRRGQYIRRDSGHWLTFVSVEEPINIFITSILHPTWLNERKFNFRNFYFIVPRSAATLGMRLDGGDNDSCDGEA